MKILYDGDVYNWQSAGGINRYFAGIIDHLPVDFDPLLLTLHIWPTNWPSHPRLKIYKGLSFPPSRLSKRVARHYFRWKSAALQPDVVHPTNYYSLSMKSLDDYNCPSVITVYDFISDLFSDQLDPNRENVAMQSKAILAADVVICISHNTRNDLLERFPHLESKTVVTYLAGDLDASMSHGQQRVPERPYFLFVGSRAKYKNFDGLLQAFARIAASNCDLALAVVGPPFTIEENRLLEDLNISNLVEHMGRVEDAHLAKLYRCSLAFVYPSFYEGFGIPPLEAMNCGTIVIASNTSSIPEVTGEAALLFDPRYTDDLIALMTSVWNNEVDRNDLIVRGRERASLFSWEKTSEQTAQIYRNLIANR